MYIALIRAGEASGSLDTMLKRLSRYLEDEDRLKKLLKPGGWLAVMTLMWEPETPFGTWHYRLDPTHIAFYKRETFRWITDHYQFSYLEYHDPRVILLKA
jgi:hypothetical protein